MKHWCSFFCLIFPLLSLLHHQWFQSHLCQSWQHPNTAVSLSTAVASTTWRPPWGSDWLDVRVSRPSILSPRSPFTPNKVCCAVYQHDNLFLFVKLCRCYQDISGLIVLDCNYGTDIAELKLFYLNPGSSSDNTVMCLQEESLLLLMLTNDRTEMRDKVLWQDVGQRIQQAGRKCGLKNRNIRERKRENPF